MSLQKQLKVESPTSINSFQHGLTPVERVDNLINFPLGLIAEHNEEHVSITLT